MTTQVTIIAQKAVDLNAPGAVSQELDTVS